MSSTIRRSSKTGRESLFFRDMASPMSAHREKFSTPGQAAAVSALWKENFGGLDPPPPPVFTLEDRVDFSPEPGLGELPLSPDFKSEVRTPASLVGSPSPFKGKGEASTSTGRVHMLQQQQQSPGNSSWWSPAKSSSMDHDEKGKGSPVDGVVQPGALIMLPPPREVARPELQRNSIPRGDLDEEEWVTVYGISTGDTNMVLREFEKCGVILKHVPGPRDANWMHILYQNQYGARNALGKNGMQINSVLIIGVRSLDPMQRQYLNEKLSSKNQGGFNIYKPLPPTTGRSMAAVSPLKASAHPYYLESSTTSSSDGGLRSTGVIASPAKSIVSKVMDLMFGI